MRQTVYYFLFLTIGTYLNALAQNGSSTPATCHIIGRCHDYGTAAGLKASLYAVINGKRQKLGEGSDVDQSEIRAGTFDLLLPTKATHLVVEMKGYHTLTIPVHFAPGIPADARFAIYNLVAMTPLDSLPSTTVSSMVDFLSLCYIETDSINQSHDTWLELISPKSSKRFITPSLEAATFKTVHFPMLPGVYTARLSTADGRVISTERFSLGRGVTFKAIRVGKKPATNLPETPIATERTQPANSSTPPLDTTSQNRVITSNVPDITAPGMAILYFDQSSPDLRTQARATLDSLTPILRSQPNLLATVTGYTDNVGQRGLNLTLSEYRARVVATYLTRRGVPSDQLVVKWKGPDSTASSTDAETIKTKSRRVTVQLTPR